MPEITERCGCGATFTTSSSYPSDVRRAATQWREEHKHAESAGICGDRPPPLIVGDVALARPHCVLKAGHDGLHSDGEGHWTDRPKITNHEGAAR